MSQTNYIVMTGFVTAEPRLGHTKATNTPVTRIRVGSTPRRLDRTTGEWQDGETSYYNVKCWRKLAVNVSACLRKGDMIVVRGKFRTRTWVDDQQRTRVELEIEADSVGHDMSFGWSHFNRGVHVPPGTARAIAEGEAIRQEMAPDPDFDEDVEYAEGSDEDGGYGNVPDDGAFGDGQDAAPAPGDPSDPSDPSDPLASRGAARYLDQEESAKDSMLATV
jgi:single-strand DNA-binding protein